MTDWLNLKFDVIQIISLAFLRVYNEDFRLLRTGIVSVLTTIVYYVPSTVPGMCVPGIFRMKEGIR